jgi:hypothetical protein
MVYDKASPPPPHTLFLYDTSKMYLPTDTKIKIKETSVRITTTDPLKSTANCRNVVLLNRSQKMMDNVKTSVGIMTGLLTPSHYFFKHFHTAVYQKIGLRRYLSVQQISKTLVLTAALSLEATQLIRLLASFYSHNENWSLTSENVLLLQSVFGNTYFCEQLAYSFITNAKSRSKTHISDEYLEERKRIATSEVKSGVKKYSSNSILLMADFVKKVRVIGLNKPVSNSRPNLVAFLINCHGVSINRPYS